MNWIEKWTNNIEKMKVDIMAGASGLNTDDESDSFLERNKTKLYSYALFGGGTALFYILNQQTLFRICGIMFIMLVLSNIVSLSMNTFKRGFKWISKK